jgi:hypothetical protein
MQISLLYLYYKKQKELIPPICTAPFILLGKRCLKRDPAAALNYLNKEETYCDFLKANEY